MTVTGRCTRYVALHLLRGAAPDQNGCIAYISGAAPTFTSPNADMGTSPRAGSAPLTTATHYLDRHCITYSPAQRPPSSATLPLTSPTAARVATTQGTTSITGHCTPYGALHPLCGAAPVMWRCTRYVALHPNRRGVMPTDRVQRTQSQEQTRNLRDDRRRAEGTLKNKTCWFCGDLPACSWGKSTMKVLVLS